MEKGLVGGRYRPLSRDEIGRIHENSLRILDEVGVQVELPAALEIFSRSGAKVDKQNCRVRIPPKTVEKYIRFAPSEILLCGRDEKNNLHLENSKTYMGTGGAAVRVIDLHTGEIRKGNLSDIVCMAKLVEGLNNVHFFIRPCLAQDIPQHSLGINEFYAALSGTKKHVMGAGYTVEGAKQVMEMAAMMCGGMEELRKTPFISFITGWMRSPLCFDSDTTEVLMEVVKESIPVALASAPMAGSTSPLTMAGTLCQLHAEEMSGIVFTQLINPGAPVLYGGVPGMADMKDLSFKAGGVEFGLMNAAISQLARYIDIPNYCSAGITEAKIPSMQAIYEKTFSVCQCALAGSNYVHHAAGVLESILTVGYGQFVIDNEIIGMAMKMVMGIKVDEDRIAFEEIKKAGPGGNFLSSRHTRKYMRTEFLEPMLVPRHERTAPETMQDHKHLDILLRARAKAKDIIESSQGNEIPPVVDRKLREKFNIMAP